MFWNPDWNETLYSVSLAERLTIEPTVHSEREIFRLIAAGLIGFEPSQMIEFQLVFVTRHSREITFRSPPRRLAGLTP